MTPERFRVALLGHGTVGAAFARLLEERADAIVPVTGMRPELAGVLTRSQGSFDEIVETSDLVVEVMGGVEPAREYVLRAMRAATPARSTTPRTTAERSTSAGSIRRLLAATRDTSSRAVERRTNSRTACSRSSTRSRAAC